MHEDPNPTRIALEFLADLSAEARTTLRAAAALGERFELSALATLRALPALTVLEHLQEAHDLGVSLRDEGADAFAFSPAWARALNATTLPSLRARWEKPGVERAQAARIDDPAVREAAPRVGPRARPEAPIEALLDHAPAATKRPAETSPEATVERRASPEVEHDVELSLRAAAAAAEKGGPRLALIHARRALQSLDAVSTTASRQQLHTLALMEIARLQWTCAGAGDEFTLPAAAATLAAAGATVSATTPLALRASLAAMEAGVLHDLGDLAALDRALSELTDVIRALAAAGEGVCAARRMLDQATIFMRLGDPVRAAHLLREARAVFDAAGDGEGIAEARAESDHLLARLPLHAPPRAGREGEAWELAREHCLCAEEFYAHTGDRRGLARAMETRGRIETAAGHPGRAEAVLRAAIELEEQLGDMVGLARATAALAELLAQVGRTDEALARLSDAVQFNLEKASPLGLAYNLQTLQRIAQNVDGAAMGERIAKLEVEIAQAEQMVGRRPLPELRSAPGVAR